MDEAYLIMKERILISGWISWPQEPAPRDCKAVLVSASGAIYREWSYHDWMKLSWPNEVIMTIWMHIAHSHCNVQENPCTPSLVSPRNRLCKVKSSSDNDTENIITDYRWCRDHLFSNHKKPLQVRPGQYKFSQRLMLISAFMQGKV